jgi:hypothetical protein
MIAMPVRPLLSALHSSELTPPQLAVVISTIYWTLLLTVPHLILPPEPQQTVPTSSSEVPPLARLPLRHDLSLHALPGLSMLADFLLFERKYTSGAARIAAPLAATAYGVFYATWAEYCAQQNGNCMSSIPHCCVCTNEHVLQSPTRF